MGIATKPTLGETVTVVDPAGRGVGLGFELAAVLCVAILPLVVDSTWIALEPATVQLDVRGYTGAVLCRTVETFGILVLLAYLMRQRAESAQRFGFDLRVFVIPASVGVFVLGVGAHFATYHAFRLMHLIDPDSSLGQRSELIPIEVPTLVVGLGIVTSAVYEETLVRSYLMTRLKDMGWGTGWVVVASTLVQASYHTYQGFIVAALYIPMFFVFSVCYARHRNVFTLILAHLYVDLVWWAISGT